ncbi:dinitrogenase iron-molybdenum cofactor biosynthesis protein [Lamprobacter modestohalophilus]|uniref:Dinitrogenase iron-molybdenum cofactor biosynthesis protein n=1 Tax=Lamprobacter modestohalophilus TaxID=1064514 RepID=A0A9X0W640_9GAMM|nr:NifB/NifX family molybdenum-iron cluster-binding protein [Lamprobacter modestohalophilus]MBK1617605.1 dinitrogenase iron-molybdenum cofactor biosynthesis protein [Lamprobacter modestohalophilus]
MKIAITAETDAGLESPVAQHFGHAPYFVLAEVENGAVTTTQVITNPFAESHEPGQIPAFIHEQGAEVMISGGMGGRAIAFFEQAGVKTATGAAGSVNQALQAYLNEGLQGAAPCAESVAHGHAHR